MVTDMSPIASAIDVANALLRQKDGKIIAVGTALGGTPSIALARYNQDGTLDNTFGSKGKTLAFIYDGSATSAALQPDGKILAAGQINAAGVARFNSDGTVDTTFNTKGYSTVFQTYAGQRPQSPFSLMAASS